MPSSSIKLFMKYSFKRTRENVSTLKLYSYELLIVGIVSLVFMFISETHRTQGYARYFAGVSFGLCAILSSIDVYMEITRKKECNLYDLIRAVVCFLICVMSLLSPEILLG